MGGQDATPFQYILACGLLMGGQDATPFPIFRMGDRQSCQTR